MLDSFDHLSTLITKATVPEVLDVIGAAIAERSLTTLSYYGFHTENVLRHSPAARRAFEKLTMVFPDGIAILWSAPLFGRRLTIANRINGDVLGPLLFERARCEGWRVFLLGGDQAVIEATVTRLGNSFPGLLLVGFHHGYAGGAEAEAVMDEIHRSSPDIVLVGMGQPRQELWIAQNAGSAGASVIMAVGGYFDHVARRADCYPPLITRLRLNWAYRLVIEPRRLWKRYAFGFPSYLMQLIAYAIGVRRRRFDHI
jgi:exopolysaccharide biosynthesis WecB/TagA/CpsF family protein